MKQNRNKRARMLGWICVLLGVVLFAASVFYIVYEKKDTTEQAVQYSSDGAENGDLYKTWEVDGKSYKYNSSIVALLFMGVDSNASFEEYGDISSNSGTNGRTDSISLVLFDRENKKIQIIAISRDSMTDIKVLDVNGKYVGWKKDHLALAYAYGDGKERSCQLVSDAVSNMLHDVPIRYYAASNLTMLSDMADLVDGVEVVVPNSDLEEFGAEYKQGNSLKVTSSNIERFIRYRDITVSQSNVGRMQRQQAFINGYISKLKVRLASNMGSMVGKAVSVMGNMVSNIAVTEVGDLAQMMLEYSFASDQDYYQLEGTQKEGEAHDEFYLDEEALQRMILKLFYKEVSSS